MKKVIVFSILLVFAFWGTIAFAGVEKTVFGPEKYYRTWGKPQIYHDNFRTLADREGTFIFGRLIIRNGKSKGHRWWWRRGVRSASISLNGCRVVGPWNFKPWAKKVVVPVMLKNENDLTIRITGLPGSYIKVRIDYEIGPMGPIFTGPRQYPFVCRTERAGLGQPLVDNHDGEGIPVYAVNESGEKTQDVVGFCKDCSTPTRLDYYYRSTDGNFYHLDSPCERPADLDQTTTTDGLTVDYIVRLERGTIDRFIYGIAMLAPFDCVKHEDHKGRRWKKMHHWNQCKYPFSIDTRAWNRKLVYKFQGGVGIGHQQGSGWATDMITEGKGLVDGGPLWDQALSRGYAVAFSTGTTTDTHYNLNLSAETMMMVKKHFISRYGKPIYTIGVGGSGGSIQQYHIAQNYPGLLDGGVPQYSYSDMITQTIYVGDCSLMEYYFDIVAPAEGDSTFGGFDPLTQSVIGPTITPRTWIEGMSSSDDEEHEIYTPLTGGKYRGSTECVEGWLGLLPLVINPLFTNVVGLEQLPDDVVTDVKWTHWDDLKNIYGENEQGYAPNTWDNVGVQYGLQALKENKITLKQFLDINAKIGGWKQPWEMVPEGYPFSLYNTIQYLLEITPDPKDFDPWSIRNANIDTDEKGVAPRTTGNIDAMHAAYQSGHVFIGRPVDGSEMIPLIDFRHYLDPVLDMHHAQQSFATRERLLEGQGHADNQLIWFAKPYYDLTMHAFDVLDEWIYNIQHKVYGKGVVVNRPDDAEDMCVDAEGNIIGEGPDAWDGILDDNEPGPCTSAFPLFSTSRIIAGGNMGGDVFKCQLIPVREAVERGFYDPVPIDDETLKRLEEIFPDGVCDYSKGDAGRPDGF